MIDERIRIRKLGNEHGYLSERTTGSRFSERVEKGLEGPKVLSVDSSVVLNKGLERGLEQGLEQGRQEGMELGVQAGQQSLIQKQL